MVRLEHRPITVRIFPKELLETIETLVDEGVFVTRSGAIREALWILVNIITAIKQKRSKVIRFRAAKIIVLPCEKDGVVQGQTE